MKWCPRNPNVICTPSFDGHISVYSLMGGSGVADQSGVDQKVNGCGDDDSYGCGGDYGDDVG